MVEKDLMEHIGDLLGQRAIKQNRLTSTGKEVYRVSMCSREKTEAFLKAILPYTVGKLKTDKIKELLTVCDRYNKWKADGGPQKAAQLAARMKAQKKAAKS
jgi:hypothetical protein